MTSGAPLTDRMRSFLFSLARQMAKRGLTRVKFSTDDFEGRVTTDGVSRGFGWVTGPVYEATIESNLVATNVRFVVRTGELENPENLEWVDLYDLVSDPATEPSLN